MTKVQAYRRPLWWIQDLRWSFIQHKPSVQPLLTYGLIKHSKGSNKDETRPRGLFVSCKA